MTIASRLRAPLSLAMTLAFASVSVSAVEIEQDNFDPQHAKSTQLDEIVVTATPFRGTADELSDPVEVLAGERLEEDRAATLGETVSGLPGVQTSYFGPGVGRPIIRGLDGPRVGILAGGLSTQDASTVSCPRAASQIAAPAS